MMIYIIIIIAHSLSQCLLYIVTDSSLPSDLYKIITDLTYRQIRHFDSPYERIDNVKSALATEI